MVEIQVFGFLRGEVTDALKRGLVEEEGNILFYHIGRSKTCIEVDAESEESVRRWLEMRGYIVIDTDTLED